MQNDTLTETQWLWCICHCLLDDGLQACPTCTQIGAGPYCTACGTRLAPDFILCEACHLPGIGPYCGQCGASLQPTVAEEIAAGTHDWEAWVQSLEPFLHGLTPAEELLLAQTPG